MPGSMFNGRRWWPSILLALVLAFVVACGSDDSSATPQPSPTASAQPVTVKRSDGKDLTLAKPPQRIVSLSSAATEVLYAIGAGNQVAAVDNFSLYPPEAATKPKLDSFQPSAEAIVAAQPDLVIIFFDASGIVGKLGGLNLPVLYLTSPTSIDGILEQIETLGQATGHTQEASTLTRQMRGRIDTVRGKIATVSQGPRIFHELDPTLFTVTPNDFVGDMYQILKAQNIGADTAGTLPQLSAEAVIQRNPQVIILADEPAGVTVDSINSRPGWNQTDAVKNGRVYAVNADVFSRPGPRIVEAVEEAARLLYPELFQ